MEVIDLILINNRADIDAVLNNRDRDVEEFVESICNPEAQASFEKFLTNLTVKD